MTRTIRARITEGMLAPLKPLDFPDGSEVNVTVSSLEAPAAAAEAIRATSGAWANLLDCEAFERSLYERRHRQRAAALAGQGDRL